MKKFKYPYDPVYDFAIPNDSASSTTSSPSSIPSAHPDIKTSYTPSHYSIYSPDDVTSTPFSSTASSTSSSRRHTSISSLLSSDPSSSPKTSPISSSSATPSFFPSIKSIINSGNVNSSDNNVRHYNNSPQFSHSYIPTSSAIPYQHLPHHQNHQNHQNHHSPHSYQNNHSYQQQQQNILQPIPQHHCPQYIPIKHTQGTSYPPIQQLPIRSSISPSSQRSKLVSLPHHIQLSIFEYLLAPEKTDCDGEYYHQPDYCSQTALLNLSSTCHYFRSAICSHIWSQITIYSPKTMDFSVLEPPYNHIQLPTISHSNNIRLHLLRINNFQYR